ncbi:MAG: AAA family ATPase [Acidimicrobiia bacterium]
MRQGMSFVGRDAELGRIGAVLATVGSAEAQGVLVVGEAGIGKTRLVEEAVIRASGDGTRTRRIVGTASAAEVPLGCLSELLAPRLGPDRPPVAPEALFHEAVAALLAEANAPGRWLLVIDDLPRLDDASAAALHHCLVVTGAPLLATARTAERRPAAFDALWATGRLVALPLGPLGERDVDRLIDEALGDALHPAGRRTLGRLAAGNPLALRELLASAQSTDSLRREDATLVLADGFQRGPAVRDLVELRLASVTAEHRRVLEVVALGEPVPLAGLQALAGPDVVDELIERSLVVYNGSDASVRSSHPLVGEVVRDQLPPGRRRRVAELLIPLLPADPAAGPDYLRRVSLEVEAGIAQLGDLAEAAARARFGGDRSLARRLAAEALDACRRDGSHGGAAARAALIDAVLRVEARQSHPADAFSGALLWAAEETERLAVFAEWAWAALFSAGLAEALAVMDRARAQIQDRTAGLLLDVTAASLVGFSGRWAEALERAAALRALVTPDDPPQLQATLTTLMAMAAAFNGPAATALEAGAAAERLYSDVAGIPIMQAVYGVIGHLYGTALMGGYDVMAAKAQHYAELSLTGRLFAEHLGVWRGALANIVVCMGVLTERTRTEVDDAVRLLSAHDPCDVLCFVVPARGLFAAMAGELDVAEQMLDRYDTELRPIERKTTVLADRGRAWLAFQHGDLDAALAWAERAWESSWVHADVATWAAPAAHDLVRFGHPERAIDRLSAAAARLRSPFGDALAAHGRALAAGDLPGVVAAAEALQRLGATGLAAEALLQAAALADPSTARHLSARAQAVLAGSLLRTPIVATAITADPGRAAAPAEPGPAMRQLGLRRMGNGWEVRFHGRAAVVRDLTGMEYLATLLSRPGRAVPATVLAGGVDLGTLSGQELLDSSARRSLENRARELVGEIQRARAFGDLRRVGLLEDEAEAIVAELGRANGANGAKRRFAGRDERARTAVRKAIKRAIDEVEGVHPDAARHLRACIRTGATCRFDPDGD